MSFDEIMDVAVERGLIAEEYVDDYADWLSHFGYENRHELNDDPYADWIDYTLKFDDCEINERQFAFYLMDISGEIERGEIPTATSSNSF